jgi:hypothetical protein
MALILLLCSALAALAATATIEVDAQALSVGQSVGLRVQVVDGSVAGVPRVPAGDGVQIAFAGQTSQRVMVNFQTTRIQQFNYSLTAMAEGDWVIGPLRLDVGGQRVEAPAVTVKVGPRAKLGEQAREVQAAVSEREPWLGQVVVYGFRFRTRSRVYDPRWTPPSFDGFVQEPTAEADTREREIEQDGVRWTEQAIDIPLVAAAEGERRIPAALLTVQVPRAEGVRPRGADPFGMGPFARVDTTTDTLTTESLVLRVRPLPPGRPPDFTGLVGSFQAEARLIGADGQAVEAGQVAQARLGDSLTLELRVQGDGSLSAFKLPAPPPGAGYRAYDDAPELSGRMVDGRFEARATFKRAVVPEAEGRLILEPVRLPVFDPAVGAYVVVESPQFTIEVSPGESGGGVTSFAGGDADQRRAVETEAVDLLPPPGDVRVADRSLRAALPVALGLPLPPLLILLGLHLRDALRRRRPDPHALLRRRLAALPAAPDARLAALEDLFREAAGLRLGRPAAGLDRAAVAALGDEAAALYAALERARYAGLGADPDLEPRVRRFVEARA